MNVTHYPDQENMCGEFIANVESRKVGVLEYSITKSNQVSLLIIGNLVNYTSEESKKVYDGGKLVPGVGSKLFTRAVKYASKNNLGLYFEVAKGSEGFYKKALTRMFPQVSEKNIIHMVDKKKKVTLTSEIVNTRKSK